MPLSARDVREFHIAKLQIQQAAKVSHITDKSTKTFMPDSLLDVDDTSSDISECPSNVTDFILGDTSNANDTQTKATGKELQKDIKLSPPGSPNSQASIDDTEWVETHISKLKEENVALKEAVSKATDKTSKFESDNTRLVKEKDDAE